MRTGLGVAGSTSVLGHARRPDLLHVRGRVPQLTGLGAAGGPGSAYPSTPPAGTVTIIGMIDDDLDDLYERAWDDGYRAALRVLHEADDDEDDSSGTTLGLSSTWCRRERGLGYFFLISLTKIQISHNPPVSTVSKQSTKNFPGP